MRSSVRTLLYDTFTDTNGTNLSAHTMDVGPGWTLGAGTCDIQSNRASEITLGGISFMAAVSESNAYDITLTCTLNRGANASASALAIVRYTDVDNFWMVGVTDVAFLMFERAAGVFTLRATTPVVTPTNTDVALHVVTSGTTISATLDGANAIGYGSASSSQTATKHGLYSDGTNGAKWDDFKVTTP